MPLALGLTIVLPQSLTGLQLVRALEEGDTLISHVPRLYGALYSGIVGASRLARIKRTLRLAVLIGARGNSASRA